MSQLERERWIAEPLRHLRAPVERGPDELAAPLDRADIEHAQVLMVIDLVGKPYEEDLAVLRRCRRVREGADRLYGPRQARVPEHERLDLLADRGRDLGALPLVGAPPVVAELPVRVRGMEQARCHHLDRRANRCEDAGRADEVREKWPTGATIAAREE